MPPPSHRALNGYVRSRLARLPTADDSHGLSVGIEHEFFLDTAGGLPADHRQSQELLLALAREAGWQPEWTHIPDLGPMVIACRRPSRSAQTVIKYEHHPFLLEVAFSPAPSLKPLAEEVDEVLGLLAHLADSHGLRPAHRPFGSLPAADPRCHSPVPPQPQLRAYRRRLAHQRGRTLPLAAINFTAGIAATQVHVGGLGWWTHEERMETLYSYEPDCLGIPVLGAALDCSSQEALLRRWWGYFETLAGAPLVGMPELEAWTIANWFAALRVSPHLEEQPPTSPSAFFASVRDLQVIRPRLFGTVEFRGDFAQRDAAHIVALAAARLGLAAAVVDGAGRARSYGDAKALWHDSLENGNIPSPSRALDMAATGLAERALGEESFLQPLTSSSVPFATTCTRAAHD